LDDTCDRLNREWRNDRAKIERVASHFEESIQAAVQVFGSENVFRKWDDTQFEERLNRAVFDVVAHSFADSNTRRAAIRHKVQVVDAFKKLCLDREFRSAIESTTKSKKAVKERFSRWYKALGQSIGQNLQVALPQ